jgi:hypothetical protein
MIRSSALLTFALIAGTALAGCSSAPAGSGISSASISSAVTSDSATSVSESATATTSAVSNTGAPSTSTPTQVSTPLCTDDVRVILGTVEGAAGHLALVLVFNNVSRTKTCEIIGYPGVDLVTAAGATVVHLTRTLRGMAGGEPAGVTAPQAVILAPGKSASALAEASDVPQGGISNCGSYSLLVTVPNQFVAVPGGTSMLPRCAAEIHPVVPGTGGGKN